MSKTYLKSEVSRFFNTATKEIISSLYDELGVDLSDSAIVDDILKDLEYDVLNVFEGEYDSVAYDLGKLEDDSRHRIEELGDKVDELSLLVDELEDRIATWE